MDYIKICCSECIDNFELETNARYDSNTGRVYFDGFNSVERLFAYKICENLEKFINPWWKQNSLLLIKASFIFNHKTSVRAYNKKFNEEFVKASCQSTVLDHIETYYYPRSSKLAYDTKYQYNDCIRFRGSGVLNVLFYFIDEDKPAQFSVVGSKEAIAILSHDELAELILKSDDIISYDQCGEYEDKEV